VNSQDRAGRERPHTGEILEVYDVERAFRRVSVADKEGQPQHALDIPSQMSLVDRSKEFGDILFLDLDHDRIHGTVRETKGGAGQGGDGVR